MATRRARIKAVTSLPPRRKNTDSDKKSTATKEDVEKSLKSPKTPRSLLKADSSENPTSLSRPPPGLLHLRSDSPKTPKVPTFQDKIPTPKENLPGTPKISEKVAVITSASKSCVFASPKLRTDSPDRRKIVSPLITSGLSKNALKSTPPHTKFVDTIVEAFTGNNTVNTQANNSNNIDEYNVPIEPESITEEAMDGIVPLQPTSSAPKPIDQLKNEIISENAEVLFDPIVPLPSPNKVRPKLRPAPRLGPFRRNSIQGSASESEDESRRALLSTGAATPAPPRQRHDSHTSLSTLLSAPAKEINRTRNDSICSSVSQLTTQPPPTSPVKENLLVARSRRQDMSRRMSAMRRRYENVQRDKLTMYDLIFYNPTTNPIVQTEDEIIANEANEKEAERQAKESEEKVDDPPEIEATAAPVPQIKLGPNGEIVIDEQSLVIKQTESKRKLSSVVHEGSWSGSGGRYTRTPRTGDWNEAETVRFYRALAAIGTDFSLMAPLFPDRKRRDLYLKFKKEEKINCALVDKALRSVTRWDVTRLMEEFTKERAEAAAAAARDAARLRERRRAERQRAAHAAQWLPRQSRSMKVLESSAIPTEENTNIVDELVERALAARKQGKRRNKDAATNDTNTQKSPETITVPSTPKASTATPKSSTATPKSSMATLTLLNSAKHPQSRQGADVAISRIDPQVGNSTSIPANIEAGSLVVLQVNDPSSPSKKMLQTYISRGPGQLSPVALPPVFLNSVIGYMKKTNSKSGEASSPLLTSSTSVGSQDSRTNMQSVIQINPCPRKRQRNNSFNITSL
ncbi:uncharacterized protein LOC106132531 [Amyelois transitella]|uniref:uncharacterized protein LOC106132531 n=1 Tax=Amyelois transitella TaxID=680683 RepID=UPI00298F65C9|nr:uncharacterized protein LOC106132531 [Amyelois transitella]